MNMYCTLHSRTQRKRSFDSRVCGKKGGNPFNTKWGNQIFDIISWRTISSFHVYTIEMDNGLRCKCSGEESIVCASFSWND